MGRGAAGRDRLLGPAPNNSGQKAALLLRRLFYFDLDAVGIGVTRQRAFAVHSLTGGQNV
jgi:hypothetical protein